MTNADQPEGGLEQEECSGGCPIQMSIDWVKRLLLKLRVELGKTTTP
jgi:hypothetical protein